MRRMLIAGIACLTLALAPLEPVHASGGGPRPTLALRGLIAILFDLVRDDRPLPAAATLPRHGVGRIDRNTVDRRPKRRRRHVNTRRGRHGPPCCRAPMRAASLAQEWQPALAGSGHQERTAVQR